MPGWGDALRRGDDAKAGTAGGDAVAQEAGGDGWGWGGAVGVKKDLGFRIEDLGKKLNDERLKRTHHMSAQSIASPSDSAAHVVGVPRIVRLPSSRFTLGKSARRNMEADPTRKPIDLCGF